MHNQPSRGPGAGLLLSLVPALVAGPFVATRSLALLVPGGGNTKSDCYVELDVTGVDATQVVKNKKVLCTDGDPCDTAGGCGDGCTFRVAVCPNRCTPAKELEPPLVAKQKGKGGIVLPPPPSLDGSVCGAFVDLPVALRKNGKKPGKTKIKLKAKAAKGTKPRKDVDNITLQCLPRTGVCPTTTTTTTTTTLPPQCGNGVVETGEACDPPCSDSCGAGQLCNSLCQCETAQACACGDPEPASLRFETEVGTGDCGLVEVSSGTPRVLKCGGLYFGGGAESVPLPAPLPDLGVSVTKTCCSGTALTLSATTAAETGSELTCTDKDCLFGAPLPIPNLDNRPVSTCVINVISRGAVGTGDCQSGETSIDLPLRSDVYLFGDLLNGSPGRPDVPGLQPCPICTKVCSGATEESTLPCTTDDDCPGGATCGAALQCLGGTNHGGACTPGTSSDVGQCDRCPLVPGPGECRLGDQCRSDADCPGGLTPTLPAFCNFPFPTSHDCPPPVQEGQPIGRLPIAFALTTGTATETAVDLNGPTTSDGRSDAVFCGFCRDVEGDAEHVPTDAFGVCQPDSLVAGTACAQHADCYVCAGGTQDGKPCGGDTDRENCLGGGGTCDQGTCAGTTPCQTDADCHEPLETCQQRTNGAFAKLAARTITMTGTPSGSLTDRAPHAATLVGIFCVPPILDPTIDATADTPGPGATAIPGKAQLLP